MWKKKLTFLFVPDSSTHARQVSIKSSVIYISACVFGLFVIGTLYFSASYFVAKVDQRELASLKAENLHLTKKFDQITDKLNEVDNRFQELVQKEIALRSLFQLPEVSFEERLLGVGGPASGFQRPFSSPSTLTTYGSEATVDRLLRLSDFEIERFAEVEAKLTGLKDILDHTPCIMPAKGWFSRGYGMKFDPFTGQQQMHRGIDIAGHVGTPIIAPAAGKVTSCGYVSDFGNYVVIDHGTGIMTRYGHLTSYRVKTGQVITRGEIIGLMGSTGRSTGPHLHYEVWKDGQSVNPMAYVLGSTR